MCLYVNIYIYIYIHIYVENLPFGQRKNGHAKQPKAVMNVHNMWRYSADMTLLEVGPSSSQRTVNPSSLTQVLQKLIKLKDP